jgi:major intracellular serine protease
MSFFEERKDVRLIPYTVQSVKKQSDELIPDGLKMINVQSQWDKGLEGEGVVVAVIDTGVDYYHPDLMGRILGGKDFTGKGDYMDGNGHGTHVAGTIAASNTGTGIIGVAPKAKILALKALDDNGEGYMDWTVQAIRYAITQDVDVINMSLGGPHTLSLRRAVQEAVNAGIIVVAAAGNEGDGNDQTEELSYPGAYPEVIQVGAVGYNGALAYFSNTNKEVDILAPGEDILSTYPGGKYARLDGTSMATPHVAGAAALLKSKNIEDYKRGTDILNLFEEEPISAEPEPEPEPPVYEEPQPEPIPEPVNDPVEQIPSPNEPKPTEPPKKPQLEPGTDPVLFLLRLIMFLLGKRGR